MGNIRSIDMILIDDLFEMNGGYVLDFSDRTFASFFADELDIDIDDDQYRANGTSKGKRLRCFLQTVDKPTAIRTLRALWDYREAKREHRGQDEKIKNAHGRFLELVNRLEGLDPKTSTPTAAPPVPATNRTKIAALRNDLIALSQMEAHPRGYAFETFLKDLFDTFGLQAREPFRLRGEQIDGSFILSSETYLLEAKWQNLPCGVGELHAFHGKLVEKAAWTRGLFISNSGFTQEGLDAFGKGKRLVCMDGLDLHEALTRELPLNNVLDLKVRRAAETGFPFIRVRDLYPS